MNAINTTYRHPFPREGSDQPRRYPAELDPTNTPLDDRGLADLLVYAHAHADALAFWDVADPGKAPEDQTLKVLDDWQPFLDGDPLVISALLWRFDFDEWKRVYDENAAGNQFEAMLANMLDLVLFFNLRARGAMDEQVLGITSLRGELAKVFSGTLQALTETLLGAYRVFQPLEAERVQRVGREFMPDWSINVNAIVPDAAFNAMNGPERQEALTGWRTDLLQACVYLSGRASAHFNGLLQAEPLHAPHMGLLIAFLQLFQSSLDRLNGFTARYLDFYYERVLHIQRRAAVPDRAWLLLTLARHVTQHKLDAGRAFKAGKDALGVERRYNLEKDAILNSAKVASVRSVFNDPETGILHAAPMADSADGQGGEFADKVRWPLFGANGLARGDIGYAVTAPMLRLAGGRKTITATFSFTADAYTAFQQRLDDFSVQTGATYLDVDGNTVEFHDAFVAAATGPKGWHDADVVEAQFRHNHQTLEVSAVFLEDQPLVNYDAKTHDPGYSTADPLLVLRLNPEVTPFHHNLLRDLNVTKLDLKVDVVGDTSMLVQNDLGPVNPARPFFPFGPAPELGSSLYVGSPDIFAKKLDSLDVEITFKDLPADTTTKINAEYLSQTYWETLEAELDLFNLAGNKTTISLGTGNPNTLAAYSAQPDMAPFKDRTAELARGFVRFQLVSPDDPFGHEAYPRAYTEALIKMVTEENANVNTRMMQILNVEALDQEEGKAGQNMIGPGAFQTNPGADQLPPEPWVPEAVDIRLNYTSSETFDWGTEANLASPVLYHLGPFGAWPADPNADAGLLADLAGEGHLFIGLENAEPGSNVSLLFHLIEGGGNPFITRPDASWSYLSGKVWKPFRRRDVLHDTTFGLTTTGRIEFALPREATTNHEAMTAGLVWLRASVPEHADALAPAVKISAQAALAIFEDRGNHPQHAAIPLPAGTIKKLVVKDKYVKKIEQPVASFGGKVREAGRDYHVRVSERLRHKNRAIAPWDYERLVLQQFPTIHKVKCLSHTNLESELAPGHVTVALIPELNPEEAFDPFRPAVSQATLLAVERFLATRVSPFVTLHVVNPKYERVKVHARVVVYPGLDAAFYEEQLETDLKQMLAPWAFSDQQVLSFGGKLHRSVILNFIEERPYVDYLLDFSVEQKDDEGDVIAANPEELITTSARSILVTDTSHGLTATAGS